MDGNLGEISSTSIAGNARRYLSSPLQELTEYGGIS